MTAGRHFYRCFRCCHTIAVEGKLDPEAARCACDGKLELLGRVAPARRRLVLDSERCACDGRCTHAPGPSCDCSCGGANHGTGRLVPVLVDAGGVPRLQVASAEECKARAAEFTAAMEPLRARLRDLRARRSDNWWRGPSSDERHLADQIARIVKLRTHKGRMSAIARALA